jgi:hypothetical protein
MFGCNEKVAVQGKLEPSSDGNAIDGTNQWFDQFRKRSADAIGIWCSICAGAAEQIARSVAKLFEVKARGECRVSTSEDDDVYIFPSVGFFHEFGEEPKYFTTQGIACAWPIERNRGDTFGNFKKDNRIGHVSILSRKREVVEVGDDLLP